MKLQSDFFQLSKSQKIQTIWQNASIHKKSSEVGIPVDIIDYKLCQCCNQVIEKQPFSLFQHTKQLQILGLGYPLWFSFLKYCILLVLILIATKSSHQLSKAIQGNYQFCYENNKNNKISKKQYDQISQDKYDNFYRSKDKFQNQKNYQSIHYRKFNQFKNQKQQRIKLQQNTLNIQNKIHKSFQKIEQNIIFKLSINQYPLQQCTSFMVYLSLFQQFSLYQNKFSRIIQFLIHLLTLILIRNQLQKQKQYYEQRKTSISDYSLMISNIPQILEVKKKVIRMLSQEFQKYFGDQIQNLLYVFKSQQLEILEQERKKIQQQILNFYNLKQIKDRNLLQKLLEKLEFIQFQTQIEAQKVRSKIEKDQIICSKVILIMKTGHDKASVLATYTKIKDSIQQYKFGLYFQDNYDENKLNQIQKIPKKIKITTVPQPNQIIWENIDLHQDQYSSLILKGWTYTFLFLAFITVAFYFIMLSKTYLFLSALAIEEKQNKSVQAQNFKFFATIIVFLAILGVVMFNKFLLGKVLHKFVNMQKHAFADDQNYSFALKYALGMFFTTALMTLAVQALTVKNFYSHSFGVIQQETIMFFLTAFLVPFIWFINPYDLIKKLQLKNYIKKLVPPEVANQLVQSPAYDLGKRYAQIFQMMWFTFLYSQLIPLGAFLILIGLILYYWVDKYNLLRRSTIKVGISGRLAVLGLKSLDATLWLAPGGQFLFAWFLHEEIDYLQFFFMLVGILYMFVPISKLIWHFNGQKFLLEQKSYIQCQHLFKQTYYSMHPVYKITHKQQIEEHKIQVRNYHKNQLKTIKHYSIGRGKFKRDTFLQKSIIRRSQQIQKTLRLSALKFKCQKNQIIAFENDKKNSSQSQQEKSSNDCPTSRVVNKQQVRSLIQSRILYKTVQ